MHWKTKTNMLPARWATLSESRIRCSIKACYAVCLLAKGITCNKTDYLLHQRPVWNYDFSFEIQWEYFITSDWLSLNLYCLQVFCASPVDRLVLDGLVGMASDKVLPPGGDMHKCKVLIMLIREDSRETDWLWRLVGGCGKWSGMTSAIQCICLCYGSAWVCSF